MRRHRSILLALLALVLGLVFFLMRGDGRFQTTRLRLSGYHGAPKNGLLAWAGRLGRKLDGSKLNTSLIDLGGHELLWSYSSPTSGWFQFGTMSNRGCWSFALPKSLEADGAIAELPSLAFRSPASNCWEGLLQPTDMDFRENVTGGGAIRLPLGRPLLVRQVADSNVTFVLQCQDVRIAYNGDVRVLFRHRALSNPDSPAPRR